MPVVRLVLFREGGGCPVLEWFDALPKRAYAKGMARLERLAAMGHELRRPEADYLGQGVYELRWRLQTVNYRVLYFFHGRQIVVLSHGLTKEDRIPPRELAVAVRNKAAFERNPDVHAHEGGLT